NSFEIGGGVALYNGGGQAAGEGCFTNTGDGNSKIEGRLDGPHAGALLAGLVNNDVNEWLAGFSIHLTENLRGDLHEIRVKIALVPLREDLRDLCGREAKAAAEQIVGFANDLHVR